MKSIAFHANLQKKRALEVLGDLVDWAAGRGVATAIEPEAARLICRPGASAEELSAADFAVVIGGDGTMLASARALAPMGKPMLGVHLGGFGFLTETIPDEATGAIEQILAGRYSIEERVMLEATVLCEGVEGARLSGLNEIAVTRGMVPRLVRLKLSIADQYVTTHAADGIIFSTATGSTAYNLAAGGPLVDPRMPLMIITPIAAHSLNAPSLVISADETVRVTFAEGFADRVVLAADGQVTCEAGPSDEIVIRRAPYSARVIVLEPNVFYRKLRTQLGWGHPFTRKGPGECDGE